MALMITKERNKVTGDSITVYSFLIACAHEPQQHLEFVNNITVLCVRGELAISK